MHIHHTGSGTQAVTALLLDEAFVVPLFMSSSSVCAHTLHRLCSVHCYQKSITVPTDGNASIQHSLRCANGRCQEGMLHITRVSRRLGFTRVCYVCMDMLEYVTYVRYHVG